MSVIFPGNYVADLNAYRTQGVYAIPGVEFYQIRGVVLVTSTQTDPDQGGGEVAQLTPKILSPDLRPDDKPRLDKDLKVPAGSTIYRTAITAVNLKTGNAKYLKVKDLAEDGDGQEAVLTANSSGVFPTAGDATIFDFGNAVHSVESSEKAITVEHNGEITIVNSAEHAYVIVEVCYFKTESPAPVADDVNLPFLVEEGSGE